jgi:predicted Zn-dependent protease
LCAACAAVDVDVPAEDPRLIAAAEAEVRQALGGVWNFAGSETLATYLDRVCRDTARAIPGAPDDPRVVVVDTDEWKTFALPSGIVLIGRGTLASLADEAELAFVLGHELAHVAVGDAGTGLLRAGLRTMARGRREDSGRCWIRAVEDRLKLGYGDEREYAADGLAVDALVALDYDVASIGACLSRFGERVECGDPAVAESALAHPPFDSRLHAADKRLADAVVRQDAPRINREIFRRAAGHTVLTQELVPVELAHGAEEKPNRGLGSGWVIALVLASLTALVALLVRLAG